MNALIIEDNINLKNLIKNKISFDDTKEYDFIFSFDMDDLKIKYPFSMLVMFLKNIDMEESMGISLKYKSNLTILLNEKIIMHDPLGCIWYIGNDLSECINIMIDRLIYLKSITRQKTISLNNKNLVLNWYFDSFKEEEHFSNKNLEIENQKDFLDLVKFYSNIYHQIMIKPKNMVDSPRLFRCCKGMPSFKQDNFYVVSAREIENQYIEQSDLVAVFKEEGKLYYTGNRKTSVDTPIHIKLYETFENINFIIHCHNYIDGAPFTSKSIPCGAIEEAEEIINTINKNYNKNKNLYTVNELGHGSILMGKSIENLKGINFISRPKMEIVK